MKDYLLKLIRQKEERIAAIKEAVKKSDVLDEVKRLGEELDIVSAELVEARSELSKLEIVAPAVTTTTNFNPMATFANNSFSNNNKIRTVGELFVKNVEKAIHERNGRFTISVPELESRASADFQSTGGQSGVFGGILDFMDQTIVRAYRRPTVSDVFNWGALSTQSITYIIEGAKEGDFTTVAEGAKKPQKHYADPTLKTDALSKIAGFIKFTNEMLDDLPFYVSEINSRLMYDLSLTEEYQLLYGDGTGTNLLGLLNRTGIQTAISDYEVNNADTIFHAKTLIFTTTGFTPDAILINPADYERLRLKKDNNGQYYGGGFFQGQYGSESGINWEPPLWGLRTVVTPAVEEMTVVVGSFTQGATPYRKGGISIESSNSNEDDFVKNLVTTRVEERIALAVRVPKAFVKVTLSDAVEEEEN